MADQTEDDGRARNQKDRQQRLLGIKHSDPERDAAIHAARDALLLVQPLSPETGDQACAITKESRYRRNSKTGGRCMPLRTCKAEILEDAAPNVARRWGRGQF